MPRINVDMLYYMQSRDNSELPEWAKDPLVYPIFLQMKKNFKKV